MKPNPIIEHDWTIHSINIHGVFFERWCQATINGIGRWRMTKTNYPVEFPPAAWSSQSQESALDIAAEYQSRQESISLLVECKKNNPDLVNWVFFRKQHRSITDTFFAHELRSAPLRESKKGWKTKHRFARTTKQLVIADEARETRGSY